MRIYTKKRIHLWGGLRMKIYTGSKYLTIECQGAQGRHHSLVVPFDEIFEAQVGTKWFMGFREEPNQSCTKEGLMLVEDLEGYPERRRLAFNRWTFDDKGAATQDGFFFWLGRGGVMIF